MFSNLRYFSIVSFLVLVVLTLFAGIYFKNSFVTDLVKQSVENQAEVLAENYVETIWNRYYPVMSYLAKQPAAEWNAYPEFKMLKDESLEYFKSDEIISFKLLSSTESVIAKSEFADNIKSDGGFLSSIFSNLKSKSSLSTSTSSSELVTNVSLPANGAKVTAFRITVPIKVTVPEDKRTFDLVGTNGFLEITFNISDLYKHITNVQLTLVSLIIASLALFTSATVIASKKAEKVIEKQQEESLEMASLKSAAESESKAKSQFLANISHELRTPLNAIIGFSEIINTESMGPIGNEQYKEFIKDIHTSGVHLLSLINDILDFSKAEEDKLQIDFEQTDVIKIIKVCTRMVMPRAEQSKVKLVEEIPTDMVIVLADQKRLKQVILNVLSNSVKFTPEGGSVTIKCWKDFDEGMIFISVKDTGVGMAPQDLARALSPFGQVDNKLSRKYEGTGLGLPLTKKLVELMRGKFDIKSELTLGTTVIVSFPIPSNEVNLGPETNLIAAKS